jgi:hypothetical protein
MATLRVYSYFDVVIEDEVVLGGQRDTPEEVPVAGDRYDVAKSVANSSGDNYNSQTLWQSGDGGLTSFDFLWFKSDADVLLELRNDNATDQFAVVEVKAGVPFMLGGKGLLGNDDATSPLGADGSATSTDDIDQITVKNNADGTDADVTATCRLVLID